MKKALSLVSVFFVSLCSFGCSTNDLECNEDTFVQNCIDAGTLEICTIGERAQFKCPTGWSCTEGKNGAECKKGK